MAINRQRDASNGLPRQSENPAVASLHPFRNMMKKLRTTYSLGNKEIEFKDFGMGAIRAALPAYLDLLNGYPSR
jgi:hypothetical protein